MCFPFVQNPKILPLVSFSISNLGKASRTAGQKLIFDFHRLKNSSVASPPVQICHMTSSLKSQHFREEREAIVSGSCLIEVCLNNALSLIS